MVIIYYTRHKYQIADAIAATFPQEFKLWVEWLPKTIYIHPRWNLIGTGSRSTNKSCIISRLALAVRWFSSMAYWADRSAGGSTFPRYLGRTQFLRLICPALA